MSNRDWVRSCPEGHQTSLAWIGRDGPGGFPLTPGSQCPAGSGGDVDGVECHALRLRLAPSVKGRRRYDG